MRFRSAKAMAGFAATSVSCRTPRVAFLNTSSRKNIRHLLPTHRFASSLAASKSNGSTSSTSCDVEKLNVPDLGSSKEAASILRSATLSNVNGETWCELQQRSGGLDGVEGPIFVSIGTPEKLQTFLELNPWVPRESILVDTYDHTLYKKLGFSRFDEASPEELKELDGSKLLRFINLGIGNLWNYATKSLSLSPLEGSVNWLDLPEGGMRNGGTLVVKGEDIIYQWSDTIPSDVPNVQDVRDVARDSARA